MREIQNIHTPYFSWCKQHLLCIGRDSRRPNDFRKHTEVKIRHFLKNQSARMRAKVLFLSDLERREFSSERLHRCLNGSTDAWIVNMVPESLGLAACWRLKFDRRDVDILSATQNRILRVGTSKSVANGWGPPRDISWDIHQTDSNLQHSSTHPSEKIIRKNNKPLHPHSMNSAASIVDFSLFFVYPFLKKIYFTQCLYHRKTKHK